MVHGHGAAIICTDIRSADVLETVRQSIACAANLLVLLPQRCSFRASSTKRLGMCCLVSVSDTTCEVSVRRGLFGINFPLLFTFCFPSFFHPDEMPMQTIAVAATSLQMVAKQREARSWADPVIVAVTGFYDAFFSFSSSENVVLTCQMRVTYWRFPLLIEATMTYWFAFLTSSMHSGETEAIRNTFEGSSCGCSSARAHQRLGSFTVQVKCEWSSCCHGHRYSHRILES